MFAIVFILIITSFNVYLLYKVFGVKSLSFQTTLSYFLFNLGVAVWQICLLTISYILDIDIIHRLAFVSASIAIAGGLGLAFFYPDKERRKRINRVFGIILISILSISGLILSTNWIISDFIVEREEVIFSRLGNFFILYLTTLLVVVITTFVQRYKKEPGHRVYIKYVFFSFITYGIFALILNLILPANGITEFSVFGAIISIIPQVAIVYTLVAKRLYKARYWVGLVSYITVRAFILFVLFYIILVFDLVVFGDSFNMEAISIGVIWAIVIAFILYIIENKIKIYFEKNVLYAGISPSQIWKQFEESIGVELDLESIVEKLIDRCKQLFGAEKFALIVFNPDKEGILNLKLEGYSKEIVNNEVLKIINNYWSIFEYPPSITKIDLKRISEISVADIKVLEDYFVKFNIKIISPLDKLAKLDGIFIIGSKEIKEPYTLEDINLVEGLVVRASVAFGRAILHERIRSFNLTLKKQVNEATKELSTKNTKLTLALAKIEEIRRQERDMIDVMGHELRTPITIVRNALLVLEKKIKNKEKITEAKLLDYIEKALESATRELDLVETLLSATKVESNRIQLSFTKIDAIDVVHDSIEGHKAIAKDKGLKLIFDKPKQKIHAFADRNRTQEIVDNLLSNAVKYTLHGFVEIKLYTKDKKVYFQVKDSGIGIGQEDIKNLGKKFFRAKQYLNTRNGDGRAVVRPGGTGLGLYVSLNLARLMKGKINIKSKVGQGSTFTLILPLYESQKDKQIDQTFAKEL